MSFLRTLLMLFIFGISTFFQSKVSNANLMSEITDETICSLATNVHRVTQPTSVSWDNANLKVYNEAKKRNLDCLKIISDNHPELIEFKNNKTLTKVPCLKMLNFSWKEKIYFLNDSIIDFCSKKDSFYMKEKFRRQALKNTKKDEERKKAEVVRKKKEKEERKKAESFKKQKEDNAKKNKLFKVGSGTGFSVSEEGHVVTNYHVIRGCQKVKIHTPGKKYISQVLSRDEKNDLALLKANFKPPFTFPISDKPPELMKEVYVAGFPFGYRLSTRIKVTKGIISSLAGLGDDYSRVQIDAAMQPGNSGGPIYDGLGNVIGVAVAKLDYKFSIKNFKTIPELTNFGIKANMLKIFLSSSNVITRPYVKKRVPKLGQAIQKGTYYVSCLMTMARYKKMKSKKVLFEENQVSAEEEIN